MRLLVSHWMGRPIPQELFKQFCVDGENVYLVPKESLGELILLLSSKYDVMIRTGGDTRQMYIVLDNINGKFKQR